MELAEALARRRMVRRYDPDVPVSTEALDAVLSAALRAPSAGFAQGVSLLVLTSSDERAQFWSATAAVSRGDDPPHPPPGVPVAGAPGTSVVRGDDPPHPPPGVPVAGAPGTSVPRGDDPPHPPPGVPVAGAPGTRPNRWLDGMRTAPVLVLVLTSREAYLDRYAEPDKGWTERDEGRWSAPYWFVDAGMAAMAMLLRAVDLGLGACFFGVPVDRVEAVRAAFGVPPDLLDVGVVSLGHPVRDGDRGSRGSPARRARRPAEELVHRGSW